MRAVRQIAMVAAVIYVGMLCARADDANSAAGVKAPAPARGSANVKGNGKARAAITVTPEREAAVMTFVQRNHAELADLLGYLKGSQPAEYERAIKEMFRTTERLAQISERDSLQYELEVASWAAQSRAQLLAAKLKMESSDELLKDLRAALAVQNDAKLTLLKHERQKASDRLSKLDGDIARFENDREKVIDRQLQLLTQAAAEGRPAKLGAKSASKSTKKSAKSP